MYNANNPIFISLVLFLLCLLPILHTSQIKSNLGTPFRKEQMLTGRSPDGAEKEVNYNLISDSLPLNSTYAMKSTYSQEEPVPMNGG